MLLVLTASGPHAALADSSATSLLRFGNWIVGCDNRADCAAIGFSESEAVSNAAGANRPGIAFRISVDTQSLAGFSVEIIPNVAASASARSIIVTCLLCSNGLAPAGAEKAGHVELPGQRRMLPDEQGAQWLDALGKGKAITATWADGSASTKLETASFLEAWTALAVARGNMMRTLPPPSGSSRAGTTQAEGQRQRAAPAHEVVSPAYPAVQLLFVEPCPEGRRSAGYRQFMLPGEALLWIVTCNGPEGASTHVLQSLPKIAKAQPLQLPDMNGQIIHAGTDGLPDHVFDLDFGILRARHGPKGRADCGIQRAWGWDGSTWFLLERREMPVCAGFDPPDWIRTYVSP